LLAPRLCCHGHGAIEFCDLLAKPYTEGICSVPIEHQADLYLANNPWPDVLLHRRREISIRTYRMDHQSRDRHSLAIESGMDQAARGDRAYRAIDVNNAKVVALYVAEGNRGSGSLRGPLPFSGIGHHAHPMTIAPSTSQLAAALMAERRSPGLPDIDISPAPKRILPCQQPVSQVGYDQLADRTTMPNHASPPTTPNSAGCSELAVKSATYTLAVAVVFLR
jgi:hypothetical protein